MTSCPTGIAHTYMAAEALEAAAARAGVDIHVETQGSAGSTPLDPELIRAADAAIFAADVGVKDRGRFAGKPVVAAGVKRGIDDADGMIAEALALRRRPQRPAGGGRGRGRRGAGPVRRAGDLGAEDPPRPDDRRVVHDPVRRRGRSADRAGLPARRLRDRARAGNRPRRIIADNTLFNLPDPAALGLDQRCSARWSPTSARCCFTIGGAAFSFLVPALAGYIAYAIADRPGIAPGFVMGALAAGPASNAGFLGGIVGGVLAGVVAALDRRAEGAGLGPRPDAGA